MTSSPGSTTARMATARAAKPPLVIATSSGSHGIPVRAARSRATVIRALGSLTWYANQLRRRGSRLLRSASTYAGMGFSSGLPTAKFETSGFSFSFENGPLKKSRKGWMLAWSRSMRRTDVVAMGRTPYAGT